MLLMFLHKKKCYGISVYSIMNDCEVFRKLVYVCDERTHTSARGRVRVEVPYCVLGVGPQCTC